MGKKAKGLSINRGKRLTFHDEGLEYVVAKVRGRINPKTPTHAYRYGFHSYPDVIVGSGAMPKEIHEIAEIKMKAIKLREYRGASPKTVLWILSTGSLTESFDKITNLYLDDDGYFHHKVLTRRGRR